MPAPTVIVDLSNVLWTDERFDWQLVEALAAAWRDQRDPKAVFYGVLDSKTWYRLDEAGREGLRRWQRRKMAHGVRYADPDILDLAERHPAAVILTTDLFRDHRRYRPWLQGTDRVYAPALHGRSWTFARAELIPIPEHEMSVRIEEAELKPKGLDTPEARQALLFDWACPNSGCPWGGAPLIEDDPAFQDGHAVCPECKTPARQVGARENTKEVVVLLGDFEADRVPVAEGTSLVFGRGRGSDRYDVRSLLADADATLVSRDHLTVSNRGGKLRAKDPGSKNGTTLVRGSGQSSQLEKGVLQTLLVTDRLSLANGLVQLRPSGRKRPRGRYAPDLASPPAALPPLEQKN